MAERKRDKFMKGFRSMTAAASAATAKATARADGEGVSPRATGNATNSSDGAPIQLQDFYDLQNALLMVRQECGEKEERLASVQRELTNVKKLYRDLMKASPGAGSAGATARASDVGDDGDDEPIVVLAFGKAAAERARAAAAGAVTVDSGVKLELVAVKEQLKRAQAEAAEANENLAAVGQQMGNAKQKAKEESMQAKQALEDLHKLTENSGDVEKENVELKKRITELTAQLKTVETLKKDLNTARMKKAEAEMANIDLQAAVDEKQQMLASQASIKKQLAEQRTEIVGQMEGQLKAERKQVERVQEELAETRKLVEEKEAEIREAFITKEEAQAHSEALEQTLQETFVENEEELERLEAEKEEALQIAAQAEVEISDVKRQSKIHLKKREATLKELQRALAKEKDAREGLEKALERRPTVSSPALGVAPRRNTKPRDFRSEAKGLIAEGDEEQLSSILNDRMQAQATMQESLESLEIANQKVHMLEDSGANMAQEVARAKVAILENKDLKEQNHMLQDQVADLEGHIVILNEDRDTKLKLLKQYIQKPPATRVSPRSRANSNGSASTLRKSGDA